MSDQASDHTTTHSEPWADYYDQWFKLDFEILKGVIDAGETSVYRALNAYHRIVDSKSKGGSISADGGVRDLARHEIDYSNSPLILPTGKPLYTVQSFMAHTFPVPFYVDVGGYAARYLMDVVSELAPQAIIELGAGDGSQLFKLDELGLDRSIAMYAAEQSEYGRKITNTLCEMDRKINISTHPFDFNSPDFSFFAKHDNVLVFTHMTLMFLRDVQEEFVLSLANAAQKVTCFHFEPFGHQFSTDNNPASSEQGDYFRGKGWNVSFMALLDRLQREGHIGNLKVLKDVVYGGDILTPKCVVSWENI